MKPVILLIDNDLGFMFWLGQALDRAGYEAFPAKSVSDALKLITELDLSVGLVILDYSSEGAPNLIATLRHNGRHLKVISLVEDTDFPVHPEVDAQWRKPKKFDESSEAEWLQVVRRVLARALNRSSAV